jgi:bifunctional DNA-binding transcriptional regulator/antitoxin component of YhaV-PrlF toxin-antitoxin module
MSSLTSTGQTTLPREVREALGVVPGDRLVYEIEGDVVKIRAARAALDALYGAFARPELGPQDLDAAHDRFQQEQAERANAR